MWVWGLLSSKWILVRKTKNMSRLWGWPLRHGVEGPSDGGILLEFPGGHCSFSLPNERGGIPEEYFLVAFLSFPFRPQHHRLDFSEIQHLDKDSPLTRNLNVLRSTENMLLFYWEVSNGSRRTLLERHRPWVYSKNAAHSAPWCMCARLIQSGIPSSPLPGDVVSSFWKILPSWGQ